MNTDHHFRTWTCPSCRYVNPLEHPVCRRLGNRNGKAVYVCCQGRPELPASLDAELALASSETRGTA